MKYSCCLLCLFFSTLSFAQQAPTNNPLTPIGILRSSFCPKGSIWVQATVKELLDSDTLTIEDSTGEILLFLASDELEALPINVGMKLLVNGRIDVSPVRPEKNELYADKIIILDNKK